jgi:hypothetical protein
MIARSKRAESGESAARELCDAAPELFVEIHRQIAQPLSAIKSAINYFGEPDALDLVRRGAD